MVSPGNTDIKAAMPKMMPDAWNLFFHKRNPTPVQIHSMPFIIKGDSIFICSPTASGKTEAAIAPLYQRHVSFKREKLSVVYVAPTKALVNDIYFRISDYLGTSSRDNIVCRYTGDHHDFDSPDNIFVLVTTPEALDSIQLTRPEVLRYIRAIVVDEIHFLHGKARGEQLRYVIARIKGNLEKPGSSKDYFQLVCMSATVHDINNVKKIWTGFDCHHITVTTPRTIEAEFLSIPDKKIALCADDIAAKIVAHLEKENISKSIIFANNRNDAHTLAMMLQSNLANKRWPLFLHIGILSTSERDRVESEMRSGRFGVCVATATLEVGIDIGDIDSIILLSPPWAVSGFLQRIGRGNRRSDRCRVLLLYRNDDERLVYNALLRSSEKGELEEVHEYSRPSVQFQQVLSLAWRGTRIDNPLTNRNIKERTGGFTHVDVVNDMIKLGHLHVIKDALIPNDGLMDEGDKRRLHTVIASPKGREVIDAISGNVVAVVGHGMSQGSYFFGGQTRHLKKMDGDKYFLETASGVQPLSGKIPALKGKRGFSRILVWQIAELMNQNPRVWIRDGNRINTWGGYDNNQLLLLLITMSRAVVSLYADSLGIANIPQDFNINPAIVYEWVKQTDFEKKITLEQAEKFKEPSKYYKMLSRELKAVESYRSLPIENFMKWLKDCEI